MSTNLFREAQAARILIQALEANQDEPMSEEDAELVIEGQTDCKEFIEAHLLANAEDKAHIEALENLQKTLKERADRKQQRIDRRRGAIIAAMEVLGVRKLEVAQATLSVTTAPPKAYVTDKSAIPAEYMRHKPAPDPEPDLRAIALAIRDGFDVPGVQLSNSLPMLVVRVR